MNVYSYCCTFQISVQLMKAEWPKRLENISFYISVLFIHFFISDEDSLSEIALSGASKLASAYFTLFYRSVHVLYTGICILGGCLC